MKASILTIGDEILIGQIINTNAAWMASQITRLGWEIAAHSSIGDEAGEICAEFERLRNMSDVILITGGLGPTHDDVTKAALCEYFSDTLEFHQPSYDFLRELYGRRGIKVSERNKTQAMLPSRCRVLANSRGTAPGMLFDADGTLFISMPGVPDEMKHLMTTHVLPLLKERIASEAEGIVLFRTLLTTGITEADLADRVGDEKAFLDTGNSLAFLPSYQGVRLRIGVRGHNAEAAGQEIARIENYLRERIGAYIYGENEDSLSAAAGRLMKEKGLTLSVAESCTGGLLGAAITDVAGSSAYFMGGVQVYSNEAKMSLLGVRRETLSESGAVSEETALELAANVRAAFGTDYGISVTGVAGPDGGSPDKPVGTVWIGLASDKRTFARKFVFGNDRRINRERAVGSALAMLFNELRAGSL